jgi:hypothetical protein
MFLLCGATHAFIGFAMLLGAGDTGQVGSLTGNLIYIVYYIGALGAFAATQAGVFLIGARLLQWGRPAWQVIALALVLYGISLWGLCWVGFLPRELFEIGQ